MPVLFFLHIFENSAPEKLLCKYTTILRIRNALWNAFRMEQGTILKSPPFQSLQEQVGRVGGGWEGRGGSEAACGAVPPWDDAEDFAREALQTGQAALPKGNGIEVGVEFYFVSGYVGNHLLSQVHLPSACRPQAAAVEEAEQNGSLLAFHHGDFPLPVLSQQL